jgi:Ser/Thr protein kinase RdoA (MazF antagonist)
MAESGERWQERGELVAIQAAGSALGTLIAALTLLLGGVLLGAIQDVSTEAILGALGALLGALAAAGAGWWQATATKREVSKLSFEDLEQRMQALLDEADRKREGRSE